VSVSTVSNLSGTSEALVIITSASGRLLPSTAVLLILESTLNPRRSCPKIV